MFEFFDIKRTILGQTVLVDFSYEYDGYYDETMINIYSIQYIEPIVISNIDTTQFNKLLLKDLEEYAIEWQIQ